MDDGHKKVLQTMKALCRLLTIIMVIAVMVSWFVCVVLDAIFYVGGLFNSHSPLGAAPLLLLLMLVAIVYLPAWVLRKVSRLRGRDCQKPRRHMTLVTTAFTFLAAFGWVCSGLMPSPMDMFLRGLGRYVKCRMDIVAVQRWLGTLDPNDCEDQPLEVRIAPGADVHDAPKYVVIPPSIAPLKRHHNRLTRDDMGRPMIRIIMGGGGFIGHWGVVIGHKDMPTPPSDFSDYGELRLALAHGAYAWFQE